MSEIRDLAPLMTSRDLLERLLATVDEVVNDEPARGSIRGCAITLAARLEQAEKILPADEVCACLDETGGRQVRIFERCERCHALMESDLPEQLAEQSDSADEWREQWERAEQRAEQAELAAKDAQMKERAMTDYFADASRRADEWQRRAERAEREMISEAEAATNYARRVVALEARAERAEREMISEAEAATNYARRVVALEARAERAERERDAVHVRLCEERDRVAAMEAALYAAPQPEAVRNWHTGGYLRWYERTRRAALASPDTNEGT